MKLPKTVEVCEVGMRDGLQIEPGFVSTEEKIAIVDRLSGTGLKRIQVTSFVSPKAVPQLRDAADVFAGIRRAPGVVYSALVPNERGAQRAVEAGVDELDTVLSASDTHNLANVNMTTAESLDRMAAVAEIAWRAGVPVVAGIATSFGCPFEGAVPLERLEWVVRGLVDLGAKGVCLADTTGMANPRQVQQTFAYLTPKFPGIEWHLHMHDTRAMGIPGVLAAMETGVTHFDASFGGLGGCPFAPGASGNVCTEDLVHCLEAMGVQTGVDLEKLVETATRGERVLGHPLRGQIIKAGPSSRRYEPPAGVRERLAAR
ncbi:MAG TPA: hydroxymethylglutaryl-CoA lyase [Dehalococcoidia bacterium]|nr:hydroxymethylglutaryl-CoA lyase [Dehalococcoidia bacterium]